LGTATQVQEKADRFRIGWDKENPAGTPAYMAPEQARGDTVDGRADQYSLGCIAYELLTGQRPLGNQGVRAAEVLEFLRSDRPIPHQPLGNLRADLPAEVEAAVHRALARSPDQRHGNIRQFGQSLAQALHVGSAPGQTWWSRLWRRPAERRNGGSQ
jgi:serine/threonine-protein kinase